MSRPRIQRWLRDSVTYGVIALVFGLAIGAAWLSRNTDAEIIERAESWPLVSPVAKAFRDRYTVPAPSTDASPAQSPGGDPEDEIITISRGVAYLESDVEAFRESGADQSPPLGNEPAPPRPLPGREADPEKLTEALDAFSDGYREGQLGPYPLFTDIADADLMIVLDDLLEDLETVYFQRYWRVPIGFPLETVVLYRSESDYRLAASSWERIGVLEASGHSGYGLAVTYLGERTSAELISTVVHEIVHLLNRRALGPALPPWLDEGIADDLAFSEIGPDGSLVLDTVSGTRIDHSSGWEVHGGIASLQKLSEAMASGRRFLPTVLEQDWDSFVGEDLGLNYAAATFFVRCLVTTHCGPGTAGAFIGFLEAVSKGEPPTSADLSLGLGRSWDEVEAAFVAYVQETARDRLAR